MTNKRSIMEMQTNTQEDQTINVIWSFEETVIALMSVLFRYLLFVSQEVDLGCVRVV